MHWGVVSGLGGVTLVSVIAVTADDARRYPLPVSVARQRLAASAPPEPLLAFGAGRAMLSHEGDVLVWRLGDADHRSIGLVTLEGDGAATKVTVSFDLADNALGASRIAAAGLTRSMAESIFVEHVDAVLGGRPFDPQRMVQSTAVEMKDNPKMLEEFGDAVRQDMIAVSDMFSNMESETASVADPKAAARVDENSFKPMTDLTTKE